MTDAWAAAQAQMNNGGQADAGQSERQDAYQQQGSRLFGGEAGPPSLFNKTHPVGTKRGGRITKAPYDQQRTKMNSGEPLFWQQGTKSPVTDAVNPVTGAKNRPVNDTVIELETGYVMDANEAAMTNREEAYEGGARRDFVGKEIAAFKEAMKDAIARGIKLTCDADMVGLWVLKERIGTKPNPNGGDPIKIHRYEIHRDKPAGI